MDAVSARPNEDRPLTDQPGAEPAALQGEPTRGKQIPLVMPDQVAQQSQCRPILRSRGVADRLHAPRASARLQMQHRNGVAEEDRGDREGERLDPDQQRRGEPEGDDERHAPERPDPALAGKAPLTGPPPPRHRGGFGEYRLHSASGDRTAQHDEIGVERQLAHHLGRSVGQGRARQHALVELAAEGLDRGLLGVRILAVQLASSVCPVRSSLINLDIASSFALL